MIFAWLTDSDLRRFISYVSSRTESPSAWWNIFWADEIGIHSAIFWRGIFAHRKLPQQSAPLSSMAKMGTAWAGCCALEGAAAAGTPVDGDEYFILD